MFKFNLFDKIFDNLNINFSFRNKAINPIVDLTTGNFFGSSIDQQDKYVNIKLENQGEGPARDITASIEFDGMPNELKKLYKICSSLMPGERMADAVRCNLSDQLVNSLHNGLKIIFRYKNVKGKEFNFVRNLKQEAQKNGLYSLNVAK